MPVFDICNHHELTLGLLFWQVDTVKGCSLLGNLLTSIWNKKSLDS